MENLSANLQPRERSGDQNQHLYNNVYRLEQLTSVSKLNPVTSNNCQGLIAQCTLFSLLQCKCFS